MVKLLAIEAASDGCSVALQMGDEIISRLEVAPRMHSRVLYPMLDEIMAEAGIRPNALDGVVFSKGPGSFTGLRIAAATAQGIGFAASLPLIGVSTLQSMAQQFSNVTSNDSPPQKVATILDARMNELYFGLYSWSDESSLMEPMVDDFIAPIALSEFPVELTPSVWQGAGNGWKLSSQMSPSLLAAVSSINDDLAPSAEWLLPQALHDFNKGQVIQPEQVELVYLRDQSHWKTIAQQNAQLTPQKS